MTTEADPETRYRDEVLLHMADHGWSNSRDGRVEAPTGHFSRISNTPAELDELQRVLADVLEARQLPVEKILGHWLLVDFGVEIEVTEFADQAALTRAYTDKQDEFAHWSWRVDGPVQWGAAYEG